jgi:putative endonuclease
MGAFVYILKCSDDTFYIACANDLERRVAEHQTGTFPGFTYARRPVVLVWSEYFDRTTDAIAAERKLKGWSKAKKKALTRGDWASIRRLSRRRGGQ